MNTNYLNERIYKGLGITPEQCNVKLYTDSGLRPVPIFDQDREGNIRIIMYDIRRQIITLENAPERNIDRFCDNVTEKTAYLTRLRPEYLAEHPDAPKYRMNPGERTRPFFPPALIEKYEQKTHIPTLFLTEGYIKAFAANVLAGFDIVGLQSVTCYTDKLGKIHKDILDLIEVCGVRNVVMIYDGDALDISDKDLAREEELTRRPYMFINSALSIKNLLSGLNVDFWFMHQHRDIPKESTKIHGITTRIAREFGKCLYGVFRLLQEDLNKADLIVAHNFRFDSHIIMAEAIRKKNDEIIKAFREKRSFDTMLFCTDLCKIEKEGGVYKWPKLSELYRFLFNKDFQGAHNSLNDIRATMEIYDELKERGIIDETTYTGEPYL